MPTLPDDLRPGGRFAEWRRVPPRFLVADVDGTLLGVEHLPSRPVLEAAAACGQAGLRLGLATGRMPGAVRELVAELGAEGPHVVHNGAQVWDGDTVLASWPLPRKAALQLRDLCAAHGLYAELYVGEGYHVTDRRQAARRHWEMLRAEPDGDAADLDLERAVVLKATVILFDHDEPAPVLAALEEAGLTCGIAHAPALPSAAFLNVTHPEADKGRALGAAANRLGLRLDAVAAVGDGLNDLSMLRVAGTAIAMGQAPPEVTAAAHLVVPEFDDDGVAHALRAAAAWCPAEPGLCQIDVE